MDQNIKNYSTIAPNVIYYGAQLPKQNQTQEIMEKFTIVINEQCEIQQFTKRLQFSRHPNICQIKYINFQSAKNKSQNEQQYFYSIYTDFLMPLLSWNVMAIQDILKGLKFLMENYGPFYVRQNMVWRDQHDRVKVWINQNPAINVPSRLVQTQAEMVSSIKKLILKKNRGVAMKIKNCQYLDSMLNGLKDLEFKGDSICIYRSKSPSLLQHNRRMSFVDNKNFSKLSMKKQISLQDDKIKSRAYSFDPEAMNKFQISSPQQYLQIRPKFNEIAPFTPSSPINESVEFEYLEQQKKKSFIHQSYCQDAKKPMNFQQSKKRLPKFLIKKISQNTIEISQKNEDSKLSTSPRRYIQNESNKQSRQKSKSQFSKEIELKPKYWTSLKSSQMKQQQSPRQKISKSKSKSKSPDKIARLKQNLRIITKFTQAASIKPLLPNPNKVSTPKFKDHLLKNVQSQKNPVSPTTIHFFSKNQQISKQQQNQQDNYHQFPGVFKKKTYTEIPTSTTPIKSKITAQQNFLQVKQQELPKSDSTFTLRKNQKTPFEEFTNELNESVECVSLLQQHQAQLIQEKLKQKKQCFADLKKEAEKVLFDCFR